MVEGEGEGEEVEVEEEVEEEEEEEKLAGEGGVQSTSTARAPMRLTSTSGSLSSWANNSAAHTRRVSFATASRSAQHSGISVVPEVEPKAEAEEMDEGEDEELSLMLGSE
jgi:hypothetical protein